MSINELANAGTVTIDVWFVKSVGKDILLEM